MANIKMIRVIVADDHRMVREGLRLLLERQPGLELVGEADSGRAAVKLVAQLSPDVEVMDVAMPDLNGIEATRQITACGNGTKIIGLSGRCDMRFVKEMLKAGASGFVRKEAAFHELVEAIRAVTMNRTFLSLALAGTEVASWADVGDGDGSVIVPLSPREREVLQLMAEGKSTKEIALHLGVSIKTIETHRRNLMGKLKLYSVAELTKYAIREGVTFLET